MSTLFNKFENFQLISKEINHEILFHVCGVMSMMLLVPLLFFIDRDENRTNGSPLEAMVRSMDFKIMVYVSIAVAFPLTLDLVIDFFTTKHFNNFKQMIPRVAICGTLLGTAFLQLYFTVFLGSVYASWVTLNMRSMMSSAVLLHQCHIRFGHKTLPGYAYLILFCWNFGTLIKCYGGNWHITLITGRSFRFAAIVLSSWRLIYHARMYYKGKLNDWYSKWHRTFFELLLALVVTIGIVCHILWQEDRIYDVSPISLLILSYDEMLLLVTMSIIITNEFRHENGKAHMQLEVKRMFVKYVSHEVRTPLNSCTLGIQYMKQAIRNPTKECIQEITGILDEVSEGCNTAVDFMNNLLMYEKIDSMELPLYLKREDLSNLCAEVIQSFKMNARQLGVDLKLNIHESLKRTVGPYSDPNQSLLAAVVEIDGPKVVTVLRNLMSNALKFTPENGEVSLSIIPICRSMEDDNSSQSGFSATHSSHRHDPRQVGRLTPKSPRIDTTHFRVILSDTGRGMAVDEQRQLFTKIVQFSPNDIQKGGGSGIGLFLSHHIMKDHGLKIRVFSEGVVNRGTHFYIDFPRNVSTNVQQQNIQIPSSESSGNHNKKSTIRMLLGSLPALIPSFVKLFVPNNKSNVRVAAEITRAENQEENHMGAYSVADSEAPSVNVTTPEGRTIVDPFHRRYSADANSKTGSPLANAYKLPTDKILEDMSVLVVDDSPLNRKMLIRTLKQHRIGKSFESINDGLKLLHHIGVGTRSQVSESNNESNNNAEIADGQENIIPPGTLKKKYDVILLDNHMIDMNGSEAIKILRDAGYDGLVVGLTGSAMDEDLNTFCAAGVDYALPKPFIIDDFIHTMRNNFATQLVHSRSQS
jgi:signal transduction histidine kinase/CheY-like chemotaxis protein